MGDRLRWPVGFMGKTLKTFASRLARKGAVGKHEIPQARVRSSGCFDSMSQSVTFLHPKPFLSRILFVQSIISELILQILQSLSSEYLVLS